MAKKFLLTPENVDVISEEIFRFMTKLRMPQKSIIRGRLTTETILLSWLEQAPEGTEIFLSMGKQFLRPFVHLYYEGSPINPLEQNTESNDTDFYGKIVSNTGLLTNYQYTNGYNYIDIKLPMAGLGNTVRILLSIIMAFITSACLFSLTPNYVSVISTEMINPIFNSFINLLSAVAAFMVFFNILHGIINMGNVSNLNNNGMKVLRFVMGRNVFSVILSILVCSLCYNGVELKADLSYAELKHFLITLAGMVPNNLVQPFIDCNTTQIIFLALTSGIIMLVLGQQIKGLFDFIKSWKHNRLLCSSR